jgi:hypothetical protein
MQTYTTWVRTPNGASIQVWVQAQTSWHAKQLLESQHGAKNVIHLPTPA